MSVIAFWVIVPFMIAMGLHFARHTSRVIYGLGTLLAIILTVIANNVPFGETITIRLWTGIPPFKIADSLLLFGRRFTMVQNSQTIIALIYLSLSIWIGGAFAARSEQKFITMSYLLAGLLTITLAITPNNYAIIFLEIATLVAIAVLTSPSDPKLEGILRFLIFQTIGMCILLFASKSISSSGIVNEITNKPSISIFLLGGGIALITPVIPFHSWIPLLAKKRDIYTPAFIFFIFPTTAMILLQDYLNWIAVLQTPNIYYRTVQIAGCLMVIFGGLWAFFENNLKRIFSFAVILQIGTILLAIGIESGATPTDSDSSLIFGLLTIQCLVFALWALALSFYSAHLQDLDLASVQGLAFRLPIASISVLASNFCIAGLPLLACFPAYITIFTKLQSISPFLPLTLITGMIGLVGAGLRTMASLFANPGQREWQIEEHGIVTVLFIIGLLLIIGVGLLPGFFYPIFSKFGLYL